MKPPTPWVTSVDGDNYEMTVDYHVNLSKWVAEYNFIVPAGMPTDLASIPWYLRWANDRASLGILAPIVHDYLNQVKGKIETKDGVNLEFTWYETQVIFLILMLVDNIQPWRAILAFTAVLLFSGKW